MSLDLRHGKNPHAALRWHCPEGGRMAALQERNGSYRVINLPECVKDACGWLPQTVLRPVNVKGFVMLPKR